jgi:hypothetical protein
VVLFFRERAEKFTRLVVFLSCFSRALGQVCCLSAQ